VGDTQARCQRAVVLRRHRAVPHEDVVETLHIREGDEAELGIGKDGRTTLRGMAAVQADDQAWFGDRDRQQGEREPGE
jgi:hypothetical protein